MRYAQQNVNGFKPRFFRQRMISVVIAVVALIVITTTAAFVASAPLPGAIFTTDVGCTGVDLNIYTSKDAVYVDGGPAHPGAAGLPDGSYYAQVTSPDGNLLGTSVGSGNPTPVVVVAGEFQSCYQLSTILITAGDNCAAGAPGYCTTENPGGEYKVWVSSVSTFDNASSKTDNFRIAQDNTFPPQGLLKVVKFYDANANGIFDPTDSPITGWETHVGAQATFDTIFETKDTPVSIVVLAPACYTAQEGEIADPNHTWVHTNAPIQSKNVPVPGTTEIDFGNVCLGGGGGLTLGFWSNKNGQALFNATSGNVSVCGSTPATDLAWMVTLNLRDGAGNHFDPATYTAFRSWLLSATATNMAYMLSAQLAAMELNVLNGKVNGSAIVYAPGTGGSDFKSVCTLMGLANTELGTHGSVLSGSPYRAYQEALKNALDRANNDQNFVQGSAGQCGVVNDTIDSALSFTYPASFTIPSCP